MDSITVVNTLLEEKWRCFVQEHSEGNIFHTPEMFRVFEKATNHKPELWAAVGDSGRVLALLMPVQITLLNGLSRYFTTRSVVYGSVLCTSNPEGHKALTRLLSVYKRKRKPRVLFTELRNLSDLSNSQSVLQKNNFVYEGHLNFLIDLQRPIDEIWNSLDSNARSNIKKAKRKGVIIEEARSSETIQLSYDLLQDVYSRVQVPIPDVSLFQAVFDILHSQGMAKFFMARVDDTYIGTSVALMYKDIIYGWYAGAIREYSAYKAGELLNWHLLDWGVQNNYSMFDFGGAGKPDEDYGPRKFKAKFGGKLVNYGRNVCVHAPIRLKIAKIGYQFARRFL